MSPKPRLQSTDPAAPPLAGPVVDTTTRLRQLFGLTRDEPALTTEKIAELRGFPSGSAARQFLRRHRDVFAVRKVGRRVLITLRDFDRGCAQIDDARRKVS